MNEIWKAIEGYEGLYEVSNMGRVRNCRTGRILKQGHDSRGYPQVSLRKNKFGKSRTVHRLVALAFIPNPENKPQVNHKDENKTNNCVGNLEWMTNRENNNYGTRNLRLSKVKGRPVLCVETGVVYRSLNYAAQTLKLSKGHISEACNGKHETVGGYHWKYLVK